MRIPERKRGKHRGRRTDHTFLRLPHYVIRSPEWRALSGNAIKFLIELASAYDGSNNGDLSLTRRQALEKGFRSAGTRDRAAQEAIEAGFAVLTRNGGRHACNLYAITWEPIDAVGKGCTYPAEHRPSRLWESFRALPSDGANVVPLRGQS